MKTISIFVSSTFRDMDLERDCLNLYIVPKLNEHFNPKGYTVQLIDLRWGITTEDSQDEKSKEQAILDSCLNVIDNCRPFFIGFIGNRYGWIPPAEIQKSSIHKIDANEFGEGNLSVTQIEIEYGIIQNNLFSTSLLFLRSENSYKDLSPDGLKSFNEENEVSKNILEQRKKHLRKCFYDAGYSNHIFEYTIPLSYRYISECNDFINLIFNQLISIIENNITDEKGNDKFDDWINHLVLNNYIQNDQFILDIFNEINNQGDILLYGSSNSGKTSISLYLKVLLEYINPDIVIFHYSPQIHGEYPLSYLLQLWSKKIKDKYVIEDSISPEMAWRSFISIIQSTGKHIVLIIDSFDKIDEMIGSNFLLTHPYNLHFILTSSSSLKKWEIFRKLKGKQIPYLDKSSALTLINNICNEYNKSLPFRAVQAILDTREINNCQYSAGDLKRILVVLLNFSKNDFDKIRKASETPENNIVNYLLKTIYHFPKDIKEQSQFLISRMNDTYSFEDMTPFYLIALSKTGLNESELYSCLNARFNLVTFSLIKHFISPYLAPKNDSGKWIFADNSISDTLTQTITDQQKEEFFSLLATGLNTNLQIYYAIQSKSANTIISSVIKNYSTDDSSVKSLIHKNIYLSYAEDNSIIQILTQAHQEFANTNIEYLLDILTFTFPREYIIGHSIIDKIEYCKDLISLFEVLSDKNCGGQSNKCYYLGVSTMTAAQAISQSLYRTDRLRGISLYERSIKFLEECGDDSIIGHIEHCHKEIQKLQSNM